MKAILYVLIFLPMLLFAQSDTLIELDGHYGFSELLNLEIEEDSFHVSYHRVLGDTARISFANRLFHLENDQALTIEKWSEKSFNLTDTDSLQLFVYWNGGCFYFGKYEIRVNKVDNYSEITSDFKTWNHKKEHCRILTPQKYIHELFADFEELKSKNAKKVKLENIHVRGTGDLIYIFKVGNHVSGFCQRHWQMPYVHFDLINVSGINRYLKWEMD